MILDSWTEFVHPLKHLHTSGSGSTKLSRLQTLLSTSCANIHAVACTALSSATLPAASISTAELRRVRRGDHSVNRLARPSKESTFTQLSDKFNQAQTKLHTDA